jgi:ABC-2 type transport system permease protein
MSVLKHFVHKEFRQIFRDRQMTRMILVLPIIQLLVLGNAINLDVRHIKLAIFDKDHSKESRDIESRFRSSAYFDIVPNTYDEVQPLLDRGIADVAVVIPQGFADDLGSGKTAQGQILVDGQNSNLAGISASYVSGVFSTYQEDYGNEMLAKNPDLKSKIHTIDAITRVFYNPEMKSYFYMIPAIAVLLLTMVTSLLNALNIVREKEIGTLEQLMVTPIRKWEFVLGKSIPFAVLGYIELFLALLIGTLVFRIPFAGSFLLLGFASALFLVTTLGVGLFVAAISSTQQQALFTAWFFMVFFILMSGFLTPIENMPNALQYLTYLDPLRYMMKVTRGIFLKGSSFADLKLELLAMAIYGTAMFSLAIVKFRKTTS